MRKAVQLGHGQLANGLTLSGAEPRESCAGILLRLWLLDTPGRLPRPAAYPAGVLGGSGVLADSTVLLAELALLLVCFAVSSGSPITESCRDTMNSSSCCFAVGFESLITESCRMTMQQSGCCYAVSSGSPMMHYLSCFHEA